MNEIQKQRVAAIRALEEGTAEWVECGGAFVDDHILCAQFTVSGVPLCWPWCGYEAVGALTYWNDSAQAKRDVQEQLRQELENMDDEEIADHFAPDVLGSDHG